MQLTVSIWKICKNNQEYLQTKFLSGNRKLVKQTIFPYFVPIADCVRQISKHFKYFSTALDFEPITFGTITLTVKSRTMQTSQ